MDQPLSPKPVLESSLEPFTVILNEDFKWLDLKDKLGEFIFSSPNILYKVLTTNILDINKARSLREELERKITDICYNDNWGSDLIDMYDEYIENKEKYENHKDIIEEHKYQINKITQEFKLDTFQLLGINIVIIDCVLEIRENREDKYLPYKLLANRPSQYNDPNLYSFSDVYNGVIVDGCISDLFSEKICNIIGITSDNYISIAINGVIGDIMLKELKSLLKIHDIDLDITYFLNHVQHL